MGLYRAVITMGFFFLILWTSSAAFNYMVTRIYESAGDHHIGPFVLMLQYATSMITNLFVPYLLRRSSYKWVITFGALGYAFNNATGFFIIDSGETLRFVIGGLGAVINGIAGVFTWVSATRYLHNASHYYKKESEKGHYFGVFSFILSWSSLLAGVVVTFGFGLMSDRNYFILLMCIALLAFVFAFIFIKEIPDEHQ